MQEEIDELRKALAIEEQISLEYCDRCGWRAIVPPDGCLICDREKESEVTRLRQVDEAKAGLPVDAVNMSEEHVHKSDKSMHEFVDWEAVASDQAMTIAMMQIENKKEWVGLTRKEIDVIYRNYGKDVGYEYERAIEAKLRDKNAGNFY